MNRSLGSLVLLYHHLLWLCFRGGHLPSVCDSPDSPAASTPGQPETELLCVDVAGYKIINVYKPPRSRLTPTTTRRFHTPVCMLASSTASMSTGVTSQRSLTVRAWTPGQHPTTLDCCTTERKQPVSSLAVGTSAPIQTWPT